jgi:hypothetical protein
MPRRIDDDEWCHMRSQGPLASWAAVGLPLRAEPNGRGAFKHTFSARVISECAPGDALSGKPAMRRAPCVGVPAGGSDANARGSGAAVSDLVHKGNAALLAGRVDDAAKLYSAGLELNPMHAVLYNNRSACYLQNGLPEEALLDAEMCISIEPTFYKGWLRKGNALYAMHDLGGSLEAIQKGIWLEPTSSELLEAMDVVVGAINEQLRNSTLSVGAVPDQGGFIRNGSPNPDSPTPGSHPPNVAECSSTGCNLGWVKQDLPGSSATGARRGSWIVPAVSVELVLELDFEMTGLPGTSERAEFELDLRNDLSQASGEAPSRFVIKSVSPDLFVDVQVLGPSFALGRDSTSVVEDLERQARDSTSLLFAGPVTCHTVRLKRTGSSAPIWPVGRVEDEGDDRNQHVEQTPSAGSAGHSCTTDRLNETWLHCPAARRNHAQLFSRSSIPWATSLIGCSIPIEWKEGSEFRKCSKDDTVDISSDEMIVLLPSVNEHGDNPEQPTNQCVHSMHSNIFALVDRVNADFSFTVLTDMYGRTYKHVSASEIRRINQHLLNCLFAEGDNPTGTEEEPVMCLSASKLRYFTGVLSAHATTCSVCS